MIIVEVAGRTYQEDELLDKATKLLEQAKNKGQCGPAYNQSVFWASAFLSALQELHIKRAQVNNLNETIQILNEMKKND